jgi:DNA-binding GntR family transcriptional regulator
MLLESYALRRVALHISEHGLTEFALLVDQMDVGVVSGDVQSIAASDMALHRHMIELAGNRALATAWEPFMLLIETALGIAVATEPDLPTAVHGHRVLLQALQAVP